MADFEVSGAYPSRVADVQSELQSQDVGNGVRGELLEHNNESAHDSMAFQLETVKQKETAEQINEIKSISPWLLQAPAGVYTCVCVCVHGPMCTSWSGQVCQGIGAIACKYAL